ncbi:HEAT repeat domain-containing protein [Chlorobaculum thiosulfatiphilum]|uniref:HEAT repeat domain-containing protein n=1 Tax=Chlorobaculum thiosulfatiphilum TaxID=115852 RepID=A0A5C4S877_CHLTI|nr:HEAT repeat domain-containing protein [Chlorobaculum thiosulfatiphilum]TNJ39626.1 HEAT repeat domain-containing protein [Chlorobaculum thiosulfatiphilum]
MANNFKSDDSFLRKLAVGAAGTNATINRLIEMGFNPIELERGSTGFKIWKKIKIKRVRVPDILCLNTGIRFESRGKTKLEISMSHSLNDPKRAWDAGMRDDDLVSIVVFEQNDDSPIELKQVSPVHFVSVREMRQAFAAGQVSITQPKGVEEGSEIRVMWTCAAANQRSVVQAVEPRRISLTPISMMRRQFIQLSRSKGKIALLPQIEVGETVEANQIVAAVVPVNTSIQCPVSVGEAYFVDKLVSVNLSERYAAAKALRYRGYTTAKPILESRMTDIEEDIYVQLEAAAALAAYDDPNGWAFIENKLRSSAMMVPLETQLETVIVASEIPKSRSEQLLIQVLRDSQREDELRAGAAWALGQFVTTTSATALVETFNSSPLEIKVEAARALLRIAEPQIPHLMDLLKSSDPAKRDGLSWVLARTGKFNPLDIVVGADENLRKWMSYIVGYGKEKFVHGDVEAICEADSEVYFAASVLWQILASWVNDLKEY